MATLLFEMFWVFEILLGSVEFEFEFPRGGITQWKESDLISAAELKSFPKLSP